MITVGVGRHHQQHPLDWFERLDPFRIVVVRRNRTTIIVPCFFDMTYCRGHPAGATDGAGWARRARRDSMAPEGSWEPLMAAIGCVWAVATPTPGTQSENGPRSSWCDCERAQTVKVGESSEVGCIGRYTGVRKLFPRLTMASGHLINPSTTPPGPTRSPVTLAACRADTQTCVFAPGHKEHHGTRRGGSRGQGVPRRDSSIANGPGYRF